MWSNHLKITTNNCLLMLSAITIAIASVRAERYGGYNYQYGREQFVYQQYHPSPQKDPPQQYFVPASAPPAPVPPAPAPPAKSNVRIDFPPVQAQTAVHRDFPPAPAPPAKANVRLDFPPVQAQAPIHRDFPPVQAKSVRINFPPVQPQAPINVNVREGQALITQIVQGSEQFTFDMIYVS